MNSLLVWFVIRLFTSIFAGLVSTIKPSLPIESNIPLFPPSIPINVWLNRVFISPWIRWDAAWYEKIVTQGYSATDGTAQFHPLYPWFAKPLAIAGISPDFSLVIISSLSGLVLFFFFVKLARFDLPPGDAYYALILFAFAPPAFILFAPYAEALFLLATILCMIFIRQKSWWLAGLMGGLATLTRQQGLFLLIPLAWELSENSGPQACKYSETLAGLACIRIDSSRDVRMAFLSSDYIERLACRFWKFPEIYILHLNIPQCCERCGEPAIYLALAGAQIRFGETLYPTRSRYLGEYDSASIFLVCLAISWKKIRLSYRLYSLAITLVSFSYYTGSVHPYMGLPRHLLLAFPIFIGLATVSAKKWVRLLIVGSSSGGMLFLLGLYVLNAWVP